MSKRKRKTFTKGQIVEVWRRIFDRWERGVYDAPAGTPGVHRAKLGGGLMEFSTKNVRPLATTATRECEESPSGRHVYEPDDEYAQKHHLSREDTPVNCVHCGADAPDDIAAEMRGTS